MIYISRETSRYRAAAVWIEMSFSLQTNISLDTNNKICQKMLTLIWWFFFVSEMIQTSNFPGLGHDQVEKNSLEEGNCNHFSELIPELFFFSWLVCPNFGTWFGCKGWCGDMRGRIHCRNCRCRYVETTAHSSQHWNDILTVNVYIKLLELMILSLYAVGPLPL